MELTYFGVGFHHPFKRAFI